MHAWVSQVLWNGGRSGSSASSSSPAWLFSCSSCSLPVRDYRSAQGNSVLEVVWAPVLLMHLGGQDPITAYNIEDNELWVRHIVTSLSQIAVAIYVFCKSWRGGDMRLLQAAILFFIPGVLKCLEKPLALKDASINSLASSSKSADPTTKDTGNMQQHDKNIDPLEEYVRAARTSFQANENPEAQEVPPHIVHPSHLFVDLTSSYSDRLSVLNFIRTLDEGKVYDLLQDGLSNIFDLLYTKATLVSFLLSHPDMLWHQQQISELHRRPLILQLISRFGWQKISGTSIRALCFHLTWAAIGLFHKSHREAYNDNDVKVTYALLCCTAVLELHSLMGMKTYVDMFKRSKYSERIDSTKTVPSTRSGTVSQYSLIGFFVRNKRHTKKMWVVSKFQCKDFLDQRWCMDSCDSSFVITKLVLEYVKKGWKEEIQDVASYRKFNDHRGQGTLRRNHCNHLCWSLRLPFDETVILWHVATDFCFYYAGASADHKCVTARCIQDASGGQGHGCATWCERSPHHERAVRCREMSNYMIYLLFVNPEMLMAGTRRDLFTTANRELKFILKGEEPPLERRALTQRLIDKVQATECREEDVWCTQSPPDAEKCAGTQECFIHGAWKLATSLLDLGDAKKIWEVIEGVWVEMLCFSAGRCRGYLHAKSMGTGLELLTYVWLLMSHMGMETLPERMQRTEHQVEEMSAPLHRLRSAPPRLTNDAYGDHFYPAFQS